VPEGRQLDELLDVVLGEALACAGQLSVLLPDELPLPLAVALAPGLALGSAAKTLATAQVLSAPAMRVATTAALIRDGFLVAPGIPVSGFMSVGSMRSPFMSVRWNDSLILAPPSGRVLRPSIGTRLGAPFPGAV